MGIFSLKYWEGDSGSRRDNSCFQLCKELPCEELVCYTTPRSRTGTNNNNNKSSYLLLCSFSVPDTKLNTFYSLPRFSHNDLAINERQLPRDRFKAGAQKNILTIRVIQRRNRLHGKVLSVLSLDMTNYVWGSQEDVERIQVLDRQLSQILL